ncbi:phycobilisome protein [Leptolyngbya sp. 'hensonii']|uniref:phycobilisome protein n=1 Tax=Leptolyngbya sp. 'hensonii' TaxID=1922337 RepID=UPI00094F7063|nr:phycobilisome protein [Leptolyngbya sp. 'hensonii']OLP19052.1 phycobilisome protein [Leptolyngbya sp. 'hensonii']
MLTQLERLTTEVDGRYATDTELQFVMDYIHSYNLRMSTYLKIKAAETDMVQKVYNKLRGSSPELLFNGTEDISGKWKRDTIRVLRYSVVAMLINDPERLQERFLFWFQTIMRAFGAQRSCKVTYEMMQEVVQQYLTPAEASLFLPILELNRKLLGG